MSMSEAPGIPPQRASANWWIVGAPQDVLLVIAAPLFIAPFLTLLGQQGAIHALLLAVALGHHLPGMMRAYGDRELFARFRKFGFRVSARRAFALRL